LSVEEPFQDRDPWRILVETVHCLVMYKHHRRFVRDYVLLHEPNITPEELAGKMGIPLGEALVLLAELKEERKSPEDQPPSPR
jgi:hypothetical protein